MPQEPTAERQPNTTEPTSLESRLLDVVQQAVIVTDLHGDVIHWNAFAERLFGWTAQEAIRRPIVELTPSRTSRDDAMAIMERLTKGESWSGEFPVRRRDGSEFTAFVVNSPILDRRGALTGIVGVSTDVSARRELEMRLQQASKMEAIGRLAGGVAHDFNNLLTVILGHAELSLTDDDPPHSCREAMEAVQGAARRAAELTRQLLSFSRQQNIAPSVVDASAALKQLHPILKRLISEDVDLQFTFADAPLGLVIDQTQFDQIVINLAINARDAMPSGGSIFVSLEPVGTNEPEAVVDPDGAFVRLRIRDTGIGMPQDVIEHAFEPFFTTKAGAQGTGLGLTTVYGITAQAGGEVHVASTIGEGTTFSVVLPRVPLPDERPTARDAGQVVGLGRRRTVLLVEDEPALRTLTVRILSAAGLTVLSADRGDHALKIAAAFDGEIDLLLSDVVMPGMSGLMLAQLMRELRPDIKVALMTGYAPEELKHQPTALSDAVLIRKPFGPANLVATIRAAMGEDETPHAMRPAGRRYHARHPAPSSRPQ